MKKLINSILFTLVFIVVGGCEDELLVDQVLTGVTRGAVFRTLTVNNSEFNIDDPASIYSLTAEVESNDVPIDQVDVFITFNDTNPDNGDLTTDEFSLETIPASDFSTGSDGLPTITYNLAFSDALSAVGITRADLIGGETFTLRFALILTDGRTFSNNNLNSTVSGGSFFRSPFAYTAAIVCPPIAPTSGEWTLELQDSYGDSWNGASLTVTIDGESIDYTHAGGASTTISFDVPDGTAAIQIVYNGGSFDEENTFQVISANGMTVLDLGPTPSAGIGLFDFCLPLEL